MESELQRVAAELGESNGPRLVDSQDLELSGQVGQARRSSDHPPDRASRPERSGLSMAPATVTDWSGGSQMADVMPAGLGRFQRV
jgi:hypothetical protein